MQKELLFREDGSIEPKQRIIISKYTLYKLLGTSDSSFNRTILARGLYEFRLTEKGRVRLFGDEITRLRQIIVRQRDAGEINPSHRYKLKPFKVVIY